MLHDCTRFSLIDVSLVISRYVWPNLKKCIKLSQVIFFSLSRKNMVFLLIVIGCKINLHHRYLALAWIFISCLSLNSLISLYSQCMVQFGKPKEKFRNFSRIFLSLNACHLQSHSSSFPLLIVSGKTVMIIFSQYDYFFWSLVCHSIPMESSKSIFMYQSHVISIAIQVRRAQDELHVKCISMSEILSFHESSTYRAII